MGKIFLITGNFQQDGKWSEPNPSFSGLIAVDDNGYCRGWCDELYHSKQPSKNKVRYLYGFLAKNRDNGNLGIAFLKLSNYERQTPLHYAMYDLQDETRGEWASLQALSFECVGFVRQGSAIVKIEEQEYANDAYEGILARFDELERKPDTINAGIIDLFNKARHDIAKAIARDF